MQALDALGVQMIEAGFPSSNPKEVELFDLLAELELEQATICAFGMTRRRGVEAAEDDPACATLVDAFAPVVTLVGKTWGLHLEKVTKVSREENLAMIAESVAFCVERGKRVDLRRRALLRRLPRRPRLRARLPARPPSTPGPRTSPSATPTARACRDQVAAATAAVVDAARRARSRSASTPTTTPSAASPTRWPRSTRARGWCRGRSTATASAAATPTSPRSCPRCS